MDKMKKYLLYIVLLIGFAFLSNALIDVALNSNYKEMKRRTDNLSQVVIYQAESTKVNGRIKGMINDVKSINAKYLKIELFTDRNVSMGKQYVIIDKNKDEISINTFLNLDNVTNYKLSFVNEL